MGNSPEKFRKLFRFYKIVIVVALTIQLSGCFFFRKKNTGDAAETTDAPVIGSPIGQKADGPDYAALEEIYDITTDYAPAAIRPDPDTYVRQLLLQYRKEGSVVAQEIGRVEKYRILLGGASEDFSKDPQETYDATSLLASISVAEEICTALVAPSRSKHPGWKTILPYAPSKVRKNVTFLAQRFLGISSDDIPDSTIDDLIDILEIGTGGGADSYKDYVPVCTTLAIDADALLL